MDLADSDRRSTVSSSYAAQLLGAVGLVIVIAIVARQLFSGITRVGIDGVDTFTYLHDALALLRPDGSSAAHPGESVHRVATFALDLIALKLFGIDDYAIRALVGAAQLVAIALVYFLGLRVALSPLLALAAAALYGLNHWTLAYARTELPHIYAAVFVLLATHCALTTLNSAGGRRVRAIAAAGAGFFAAGGAAAHEDLILFALGLALTAALVVIVDKRRHQQPWGAHILRLAGLFIVGAVGGVAWPMLATGIGPRDLIGDVVAFRAGMDANTALRTGQSLAEFLALVPLRIFGELGFSLIGLPLVVLSVSVAATAPFRWWASGSRPLRDVVVLELPVVFYLLGLAFAARVYLEGDYARILLPLLGPIFVFTLSGGAELSAAALRPIAVAARPAATALCLALAATGAVNWDIAPPAPEPSMHRRLYDGAKAWVGEHQRLLLPLCYGVYRPWVGVGSPVYLGDRAVPSFGAGAGFITEHQIKYVLVLSDYRYRPMTQPDDIRRMFATLYGVVLPENLERSVQPVVSIKRPAAWWLPQAAETIWPHGTRVWWSSAVCAYESEVLTQLLTELRATIVSHITDLGDIYALP